MLINQNNQHEYLSQQSIDIMTNLITSHDHLYYNYHLYFDCVPTFFSDRLYICRETRDPESYDKLLIANVQIESSFFDQVCFIIPNELGDHNSGPSLISSLCKQYINNPLDHIELLSPGFASYRECYRWYKKLQSKKLRSKKLRSKEHTTNEFTQKTPKQTNPKRQKNKQISILRLNIYK